MNDVDNEVISRDIILLDLVCSINPDDISDIEFLWDVWYNMTLTEGHYTRLKVTLERLVSGSSSSQWKFGDTATKKRVMMTWKSWLENEPRDMESVRQSCQDYFEFCGKVGKTSFSVTMPSEQFYKNVSIFRACEKHLIEWNSVYRDGIARDFVSCIPNNKEVVNPTMMRPGSSKWHVHYGSNPLAAYLPFER